MRLSYVHGFNSGPEVGQSEMRVRITNPFMSLAPAKIFTHVETCLLQTGVMQNEWEGNDISLSCQRLHGGQQLVWQMVRICVKSPVWKLRNDT